MSLPFATLAQSLEGDLAGSVQDYSGARVPLARIVVQSVDSAVEHEARTDNRGEFRLNLLPPGAYHVSLLSQAEGARPITLITPVDVNGLGDTGNDRVVVNGVQTSLDQFRGTRYIQVDMRVSRPIRFRERWSVTPFIEFFNLFDRSNPGANYLCHGYFRSAHVNNLYNATAFCLNTDCSQTQPVTAASSYWCPPVP